MTNLVSANGIKNQHLILVGQQLKLAGNAAAPVTTTTTTASTYTVKSGDTLSKIAGATQVSVANLVAYNHLANQNLIYVGDILKLTGSTQTTPAAVKTTPVQTPTAPAKAPVTTAPVQQAKPQTPSTATVQQAKPQAQTNTQATTQSTSSAKSYGTFKLSFYDPAVLGSNMGYSGVAANLSVFPKGTRLKITLSNGTVWYRTVNDTGSFAQANPRQLDVAMPSSQIPSAGILSASVEVLN